MASDCSGLQTQLRGLRVFSSQLVQKGTNTFGYQVLLCKALLLNKLVLSIMNTSQILKEKPNLLVFMEHVAFSNNLKNVHQDGSHAFYRLFIGHFSLFD